MLLSNRLKEDFGGGGGLDMRERSMAQEKRQGKICSLVSLAMVQSASVCSCLFTHVQKEDGEWEERG